MCSFATVTAAASIGALSLPLAISPPSAPPPPVSTAHPVNSAADVRLAAATVPIGAIPAAFIRNQLTFCSLICPSVVQLATTVPVGAAQAPLAFVDGLQSGSLLAAIGAAAQSVTGPADVATTGIITPDVFIVVPKAIGTTLPIVIVGAFNVGEAVLSPGDLGPAIETARMRILEALNTPASLPPTELPSGAQGFVEVATVSAVNVADAVAFRAGELLISGAVHTANVTATELANTGNVGSALGAGSAAANVVVNQARGIITNAVDTAVTNVRGSLHQPQTLAATSTTMGVTPKVVNAAPAKPSGAGTGPVANAVKSATHNLRSAFHGIAKGNTAKHRA
jgi:hypothetical protein